MTEEIFIKDWISYEEAEEKQDIGFGLGGWFQDGNRWGDYLEMLSPKEIPYYEVLRQEILKRELHEGGDWHQHSGEGVPLFSDDTVMTYSFRAWGDLLAAIWSTEYNEDFYYMDFYMSEWQRPRSKK
jgi:hypothetical protein